MPQIHQNTPFRDEKNQKFSEEWAPSSHPAPSLPRLLRLAHTALNLLTPTLNYFQIASAAP